MNIPENEAHPDLVYYIRSVDGNDKRILLITSHKTTTSSKGIEKSDVENALLGLDITSVYKKKGQDPPEYQTRRQKVIRKLINDYLEHKLVGIIRLLIVLPRYQGKTGANKKKIEDESKKTEIQLQDGNFQANIPQCLLVVTEENLETCGLFSQQLAKFLVQRFNCKCDSKNNNGKMSKK
jgi:hypothetical protein